jgi:hypothetical protein
VYRLFRSGSVHTCSYRATVSAGDGVSSCSRALSSSGAAAGQTESGGENMADLAAFESFAALSGRRRNELRTDRSTACNGSLAPLCPRSRSGGSENSGEWMCTSLQCRSRPEASSTRLKTACWLITDHVHAQLVLKFLSTSWLDRFARSVQTAGSPSLPCSRQLRS